MAVRQPRPYLVPSCVNDQGPRRRHDLTVFNLTLHLLAVANNRQVMVVRRRAVASGGVGTRRPQQDSATAAGPTWR